MKINRKNEIEESLHDLIRSSFLKQDIHLNLKRPFGDHKEPN